MWGREKEDTFKVAMGDAKRAEPKDISLQWRELVFLRQRAGEVEAAG